MNICNERNMICNEIIEDYEEMIMKMKKWKYKVKNIM